MDKHTNSPVVNAFNVVLVLVAFDLAALSLPSVLEMLFGGAAESITSE